MIKFFEEFINQPPEDYFDDYPFEEMRYFVEWFERKYEPQMNIGKSSWEIKAVDDVCWRVQRIDDDLIFEEGLIPSEEAKELGLMLDQFGNGNIIGYNNIVFKDNLEYLKSFEKEIKKLNIQSRFSL